MGNAATLELAERTVLTGEGEARVCIFLVAAGIALGLAQLTLVALGQEDGQFLLGILQIVLALGAFAAFLLWLYEAHANLAAYPVDDLSFSSSWAIAAFFVPVLNLVLPVRVVQEVWKASDPDRSNATWRGGPASNLVRCWWASVLILVPGVALTVLASLSTSIEDDVEHFELIAAIGLPVLLVVALLGSLLSIGVVRGVQARQRQKLEPLQAEPVASVPRFRWPLRIFLAVVVFDIVVHSLATLSPYRTWLEEKGIALFPKRLPSRSEIASLSASQEKGAPVRERVFESLDSVWEYFKPWPDKSVRAKLVTWEDHAAFLFCWLTSRVDFCEHLVATAQRWTMFSPNAAKSATMSRSRLLYADGSVVDIRLTADPPDLTRYAHWFEEKTLDYELKVAEDWDSRVGYCNYLSHRYRRNAAGAALDKIYVYKFRYEYPSPDEDAVAKLRAQNGPPNWDKDGPFFVYDAASQEPDHHRRGRKLPEAERKTIQAELARAAAK